MDPGSGSDEFQTQTWLSHSCVVLPVSQSGLGTKFWECSGDWGWVPVDLLAWWLQVVWLIPGPKGLKLLPTWTLLPRSPPPLTRLPVHAVRMPLTMFPPCTCALFRHCQNQSADSRCSDDPMLMTPVMTTCPQVT